MTKIEFLAVLRDRLSGLPQEDITERLNFYAEMIDDRMEEGLAEEEAVLAIGSLDDIIAGITADASARETANKKISTKRHLTTWEIVLLVVGSPVWLSLLISAISAVVSLYASLWAVIVSLWAAFASLVGCALGGLIGGVVLAVTGNGLSGLALIGAALVCAGLSILVFFGCRAASKGTLLLTKKTVQGIKKMLTKKEDA